MRIVTEPQAVSVAGMPAVEATIEDASGTIPYFRRYLVIHYAGTASLIVIEAPADRWRQHGPMLDKLLQQSLEIGSQPPIGRGARVMSFGKSVRARSHRTVTELCIGCDLSACGWGARPGRIIR